MIQVHIGTAGWAIPKAAAPLFGIEGTGLERYARGLNAVEINTTFYRSHRATTYARWKAAVPPGFKFAVKLPRKITHEARLEEPAGVLAVFCAEVSQLGDALGPLLIQLPPSLSFSTSVHEAFFDRLRQSWTGRVVCEPRHPSWFEAEPDALLNAYEVGRVAADPARHPLASEPGGWPGIAYWRFHGSPKMYASSYSAPALDALARSILASGAGERWCVFDNTSQGAATLNALDLISGLDEAAASSVDRTRGATPILGDPGQAH